MRFDTKIAVLLRDDLLPWQELNVTAFVISGIATLPDILGSPYIDGSDRSYLPMIRQPIMVFASPSPGLRLVYDGAISERLSMAIYTAQLFATPHDEANRAAVRAVRSEDLDLVGIAILGPKKTVDRLTKGVSLHR
jgi:hypothetical protein